MMKAGDKVFHIQTGRLGVVKEVVHAGRRAYVDFPTGVELIATANLILALVKIINEGLPYLKSIFVEIKSWFKKRD